MKKRTLILSFLLFICLILTGCSSAVKLNKTVTISKDKIKLTVLESERVTIDKGDMYLGNGEYIKVKVTVENIGDDVYSWSATSFSLGDELASLLPLSEPDILAAEIEPGKSATGYVYFPVTDSDKLTYTSYFDESGKAEKKIFNIK